MIFDFAVIGAGCAGIAIAAASTKRNYSCVVLEFEPCTGLASVRNQGWLQSGALYAFGHKDGADSTVNLCREGSQLILEAQRQLNIEGSAAESGLMIYNRSEEFHKAFDIIREHGLPAKKVNLAELSVIEPILATNAGFVGGILTPDVPINVPVFLNCLSSSARSTGAIFRKLSCPNFTELHLEYTGDHWRVRNGIDHVADCHNIIFCAGVRLPTIVEKCLGANLAGSISNCMVLALRCYPTQRIIMMRDMITHNLNIAPYVGGVTINLGALDERSLSFDDLQIRGDTAEQIVNSIADYAPGLASFLPAGGTIYTCQKYNPPKEDGQTGGLRNYIFREVGKNCFVFYPGKFTQSLIGAERVIEHIGQSYGRSRSMGEPIRGDAWSYLHPGELEPDLLLEFYNGRFVLRPMR